MTKMKCRKTIWIYLIGILLISIRTVFSNDDDDLDDFFYPGDADYLTINHELMDLLENTSSVNSSYFFNEIKNKTLFFFNAVKIINYTQEVPKHVDCLGFGNFITKFKWLFDLTPLNSEDIRVKFYFSNRRKRQKLLFFNGEHFTQDWIFFDPTIPTIVIVHGFMNHIDSKWIQNMSDAFLDWNNVNVFMLDWSRGGRTWKYWRAVANTRTVGSDLANFLQHLMNVTGLHRKDLHLIGHSLGAHICSYASSRLGGVRRITGLDPAQPCFVTTNLDMLLDKTDADFVDIIHTNGRLLKHMGLGLPNNLGHQDFYPNGGSKQPGCQDGELTKFSKLIPLSRQKFLRAKCNHGRAYKLFIESLKQNNCFLIGHHWNLKYSGINASINTPCNTNNCAKLGIDADQSEARGSFYVFTTSDKPYCDEKPTIAETRNFLLNDLIKQRIVYQAGRYTVTSATTKMYHHFVNSLFYIAVVNNFLTLFML